MQQLLVYADSLSWGIVPTTRQRLPFDQRWPGVLENALSSMNQKIRVLEDCLNGRRTVWDDPFKQGRNGQIGLAQRIEMHSPLALVILMLGTNDFQSMHDHNAWHSSQGLMALIQIIRTAPIELGMPIPQVLVICPPPIQSPKGPIAPKFEGADRKCVGLAVAYRQVCLDSGCHFFDAAQVTTVSPQDGVHLDAPQHQTLGLALVPVVQQLLMSL